MGIPIAAGVFYGIWGITLRPMIAVAAMCFSSVSIVTNALRDVHTQAQIFVKKCSPKRIRWKVFSITYNTKRYKELFHEKNHQH